MMIRPAFPSAVCALFLASTSACSPSAGEGNPDDPTPPDVQAPSLEQRADLAYEPPPGVTSELATLDVYLLPDGEPKPLVVLVHGGSWVGGDKDSFDTAAPDFIPWWTDRGYVAAAVNFRLATPLGQPQQVAPTDQARDIAHALAWLVENAEEHEIAAEPVVLVGYSSGAHLVALLGANGEYLTEAGLDESRVRATVSLDVHAYDVPFALQLMVGSTVEQNIPLIEHLFGDTEEAQLVGSPIAYTDGDVPPAMLVSVEPSPEDVGSHGYIVSQAAERYAQALLDAGHVAETFHDSAETHGTLATGFGADDDPVTEAVGAFLDALP